MCLAVRTDQHIQLAFVFEQIWPRLIGERLVYEESIDLIVRSFSDEPINRLYVLSPFQLEQNTDGTYKIDSPDIQSDWPRTKFDWVLTSNPQCIEQRQGAGDIYRIQFRGEAVEGENQFDAVRLKPVLKRPEWLPKAHPNQVAALVGTGMTLAFVEFENGLQIERYDPVRSKETTYWIRLRYSAQRVSATPPASFGFPNTLFRVRPCTIFSPEEVISELESKFDVLVRNPAIGEHAREAKKQAMDKELRISGSSVQILDHRISIVTDQQRVLVLNAHHEGACAFTAVEEFHDEYDSNPKGHFSRNFFTGANFFPHGDAMTLTKHALDYFRQFAKEELTSKTKEEVNIAICAGSHANVSHIVDVLEEFNYLTERETNKYFVGPTCVHDEFVGPESAGTKMLRCLYQPVVNRLTGFSPPGYRIVFDLAFA